MQIFINYGRKKFYSIGFWRGRTYEIEQERVGDKMRAIDRARERQGEIRERKGARESKIDTDTVRKKRGREKRD